MDVIVNGAARRLEEGATVDAAVAAGAPRTSGIAVAVNDEVVPQQAWSSTVLAPGDRVEIVVAMQGG